MNRKVLLVTTAVAIGFLTFVASLRMTSQATATVNPREGEVAAVGLDVITADKLETAVGTKLFPLKSQEYAIRRGVLEELITQDLLEKEARARRVTVEALTELEVVKRATPVTDDEVAAVLDAAGDRLKGREEEALASIRHSMTRQRIANRRMEFLKQLRKRYNVHVWLSPPRLDIDAAGNPAMGPASAPVEVVEFVDYECPYCTKNRDTLRKLQQTYGNAVRVVSRDFPLPFHPNAAKAAEAAACANEQGRFWEYRDRLFETQKLSPADVERHARDLRLDAAAFATCLASGRYVDEWRKDRSDGERYGIRGTPAYFINGRLVAGAQPFESLSQIVDEEIEVARSRPTHAGPSK